MIGTSRRAPWMANLTLRFTGDPVTATRVFFTALASIWGTSRQSFTALPGGNGFGSGSGKKMADW